MVLPCEDSHWGWGLFAAPIHTSLRMVLGFYQLLLGHGKGPGWPGMLVCDNVCQRYQKENGQNQFISFPTMFKYL